jgi:hypothetical protein
MGLVWARKTWARNDQQLRGFCPKTASLGRKSLGQRGATPKKSLLELSVYELGQRAVGAVVEGTFKVVAHVADGDASARRRGQFNALLPIPVAG